LRYLTTQNLYEKNYNEFIAYLLLLLFVVGVQNQELGVLWLVFIHMRQSSHIFGNCDFLNNYALFSYILWTIKSHAWDGNMMTCKGICIRHKAEKPMGIGRYASGQKRCQIC